jgi:10-carbomethoxy-13-deoxycarminomycin esterase/esterase
VTERTVSSAAVELWSEDFGDPSGPPLLLVMGANASAFGWPDEFVELLAAGGLHVLRYDHRDTGRSTRVDFARQPYCVADLARDAVAVLDGWGLGSAHVVGFSMGTTLGQLLALDHRERLRTLTLVAGAALDVDFVGNLQRSLAGEPSPDGLPTPDAEIVRVLARRARPVAGLEDELDRRVAEWRALSGTQLPFDPQEFRRQERRAIEHAGSWSQPGGHALAAPVPTRRGSELGGVTTPTLVVQAPLDPLNPPPHGRHLADLIPGARLAEVPGMGHALPSAVHRPLAELILEQVRRHP